MRVLVTSAAAALAALALAAPAAADPFTVGPLSTASGASPFAPGCGGPGEALLRSRAREDGGGPRLCCLVLEDPRSVALSNEPVMVDEQVVGRVTSGGYGYTVERSIAYAYLPAEASAPGTEVAVEVFGEWVGANVRPVPLYDPEGQRVRA